jgi:plastocyanin
VAVKVRTLSTLVFFGSMCTASLVPAWGASHSPSQQNSTKQSASEYAAQDHIVEIHKFKFQTILLDVKVGDTVTWINKDIVPHTATALDKSWDSGRLKKDESFTLTITDETSLEYFCAFHRQMKAAFKLVEN